jgi:anti-sigma factor RsiW
MMTCRDFVELLIEFLHGELSPEQRAEVETHLGLCPPCVRYLETYRLTITITRQLPPAPLPTSCEQRLRAALEGLLREET